MIFRIMMYYYNKLYHSLKDYQYIRFRLFSHTDLERRTAAINSHHIFFRLDYIAFTLIISNIYFQMNVLDDSSNIGIRYTLEIDSI